MCDRMKATNLTQSFFREKLDNCMSYMTLFDICIVTKGQYGSISLKHKTNFVKKSNSFNHKAVKSNFHISRVSPTSISLLIALFDLASGGFWLSSAGGPRGGISKGEGELSCCSVVDTC